jgi:hypothetical protein
VRTARRNAFHPCAHSTCTAANLICGKMMLHIVPNPFAAHNMKWACCQKTGYCSGINIGLNFHGLSLPTNLPFPNTKSIAFFYE